MNVINFYITVRTSSAPVKAFAVINWLEGVGYFKKEEKLLNEVESKFQTNLT